MLWLIVAAFVAAFGLTAVLRRYALRRQLLDVPNGRSSHVVPTPRGGGVAIVAVVVGLLPVLWLYEAVNASLVWALFGAGLAVALLGFADDHGHIAARWRLLGHFVAAMWAMFWLGGLPALTLFGMTLEPGWLGNLLGLLFLVWMLNLYNFMDGIDGLASVEAISVCLGVLVCYGLAASSDGARQGDVELLLAAAVAGFCCWNFPRARIFMGDAGSGFLGIVLGILALGAAWVVPQLLWSWLILLGVFIVDATFTLLRRLLRGEAVYQAHRSHAYQAAARRLGRHVPVTVAVGLINVGWLLPWAAWVASGGVEGATALVIAYLPLLCLCIRFHAGAAEAST
ncbi:MraY family glycosyltransferase [Stutzerimonas stutzeri]|uniref:MraY family glycosyltransferase n=1 Tax=Stutzerimonas stutzeri TaxID=316 RepID=UPI0015E2A46A|nr:glycosyltransferase family 4 protein [Stutzerimonas stutzeri]MBA1265629.1 glycosyltransferase family 4 protein [Stutzerimonas stutzeri]